MEIRVPHEIIYELSGPVPISAVIESLEGVEELVKEVSPLLEAYIDGLTIESTYISVVEISQRSPLKELFSIGLFTAFQKDLTRDVPNILESLTGVHIPPGYVSIVTLAFVMLLFHAMDLIFKKVNDLTASAVAQEELSAVISEIAKLTGKPEKEISDKLHARFAKGRAKSLIQSVIRVVKPSKVGNNAPMTVQGRRIEPRLLSKVPSSPGLLDLEPVPSAKPYENILIELHAQDLDRSKQGWAAVIPSISENRLRMELYPPIKPSDLYTRSEIRGDVLVISREKPDGRMEPYLFHLVRLRD